MTPLGGVSYYTSMKSIQQRLNNINGQINGVKKMIESESDCILVLTQLKAVKSAVEKVMDTVVEEQFDKCLTTLDKKDKETLIKIKKYVKSN